MEHYYKELNTEHWFTFQELYSDMVNIAINNSHFVEVGTWKGESAVYMAVEILNSNKHIKFDCVDVFINNVNFNLNFDISIYKGDETIYNEYLSNIKKVNNQIETVRMLSYDAAKLYKNNSLDFVFIDASHDYENVKADILSWFPKVKQGGYIGGHDYNDFHCGVVKAVTELFSNYHNKVKVYDSNITINPNWDMKSWLLKK